MIARFGSYWAIHERSRRIASGRWKIRVQQERGVRGDRRALVGHVDDGPDIGQETLHVNVARHPDDADRVDRAVGVGQLERPGPPLARHRAALVPRPR